MKPPKPLPVIKKPEPVKVAPKQFDTTKMDKIKQAEAEANKILAEEQHDI